MSETLTCPGCRGTTTDPEAMRRHEEGCLPYLRARVTTLKEAAREAQGALVVAGDRLFPLAENAGRQTRHAMRSIANDLYGISASLAAALGPAGEESRNEQATD